MEEDENNNGLPAEVGDLLEIISAIFGQETEQIYEMAMLNWLSLKNQCDFKDLDEKKTLFVCAIVLALASVNFKEENSETLGFMEEVKSVSLSDAISFLKGESPEKEGPEDEGFKEESETKK